MSLIFGRLGKSFVGFGASVQGMAGGNPTPEQYALYQQAADAFKRDSAQNAVWLVCIGQYDRFATLPTPKLTWFS
jgi:hypothetical protein